MRWTLPVLAAFLCGCLEMNTQSVGSACSGDDTGACDMAQSRLLQCSGGTYVVYSDCKGERGCSVSEQTVSCDSSGNTAGDICAPESVGKVRCEPDAGPRILRCIDRVLTVEFTCPEPTICGFSDGGLTCI